jgi:hypothetical protein
MNNQPAIENRDLATGSKIFAAIELSSTTWVVALHLPTKDKISTIRIVAGDVVRLVDILERAGNSTRSAGGLSLKICTCYEAGYDGFWLHRLLVKKGINTLERDYRTVLLASHEPPCLSLYQPTHRAHPDKQQDPIRFRNLVKDLELSLRRKYAGRESASILRPFHDLAENGDSWNRACDGIAIFATGNLFKVYWLQRPVRQLAVVAESFHTKPLMRILQSTDRYHVLGLNREEATLFDASHRSSAEMAYRPCGPIRLISC